MLVGVLCVSGCLSQQGVGDEMTTVFADSDSESGSTLPTTLGTTTSTVTTAPLTTGDVNSSTTASDTDTTTGDTSTTEEEPLCNYDTICDVGETLEGCLHDCAGCEPDGICDGAFETPFACPSDCPATSCDLNGELDALEEQCDDGDHLNNDACTDSCQLNVCGDSMLYPEMEECDDGNLDDADGCNTNCEQALRLIFLSSKAYPADFMPPIGQLTGLELADAHCQELADAADLPGVYMAWLSSDKSSPSNRFGLEHTYAARYERVDGKLLGDSWIDLRVGKIDNPISVFEGGTKTSGGFVWSNTMNGGSSVGSQNCKEWTTTSSDSVGWSGDASATSSSWSQSKPRKCNALQRIYCVQVNK